MQVIGVKPLYSNKISEGIFDELNRILNNLVEQVNFEAYFDINRVDEH